jgi:hypothetical protein
MSLLAISSIVNWSFCNTSSIASLCKLDKRDVKQMANHRAPKIYDKREIIRRDFLKAGGAIIDSAVLFDSLAACTPKTTTIFSITAPTTLNKAIATTTLTPKYGGFKPRG